MSAHEDAHEIATWIERMAEAGREITEEDLDAARPRAVPEVPPIQNIPLPGLPITKVNRARNAQIERARREAAYWAMRQRADETRCDE